MDERDDYADNDLPPLLPVARRWFEVAMNLLVVIGLVGFALIFAGLIVVKVAEMRRIQLPKVPEPDTSFNSGTTGTRHREVERKATASRERERPERFPLVAPAPD